MSIKTGAEKSNWTIHRLWPHKHCSEHKNSCHGKKALLSIILQVIWLVMDMYE